MRQFYLQPDPAGPPQAGDVVTLDREESHHLKTVLRGGRSDRIGLVDGRGLRFDGRLLAPTGAAARVEILAVLRDETELREPHLVLGCAVVKGKRFEWALEKAVELGAHRIVPLVTERGVIEPGAGRQERWLSILRSGLKQSGRSWLPELSEPVSPQAAVADAAAGTVLFGAVPDEIDGADERSLSWLRLLEGKPPLPPPILAVLIGPEGGWTGRERDCLLQAGAIPVHLGEHVLRTETAAAAGLFALQAIRESWTRAEPSDRP